MDGNSDIGWEKSMNTLYVVVLIQMDGNSDIVFVEESSAIMSVVVLIQMDGNSDFKSLTCGGTSNVVVLIQMDGNSDQHS